MIKLTDCNGCTVSINEKAIASVCETAASSQWHGICAVVRMVQGDTFEVRERVDHIARLIVEVDVDTMVDRFLCWKLPKDFNPDAGVSFTPPDNPLWWPVGTNLLTAEQTREMLLHVLGGGK